MWVLWTSLIVILLDQASKYAIYYGHVVGTLGYTGAPTDLAALKAFLATVANRNAIPQDGNFLVLSFTANDAALFGIGNGTAWAARLLAALTSVFLFLLLFFAVRTAKLYGGVLSGQFSGTKRCFPYKDRGALLL